MKANLEQLEEMQKQLFNKQCYLDIQKAMVKHFIKNEKAKQLTLTDVGIMLCKCGGKKYKQRMFEMDYLTCEECGISKLA